MKVLGWLWFLVVQLITAVFMVLGWLLLIPFCLSHAWKFTDFGHGPDVWRWAPLNWVYGNPEDGVSGQHALIWNAAGTAQVPYLLTPDPPFAEWRLPARTYVWLWDAWRAYCWSAWRNSCDNLKYVFAWSSGPQVTLLGRKFGWWPENGKKVPVL